MGDKQTTGSDSKAWRVMVVAASLFAATGPSALAQSGYLRAMGEAVERALPPDAKITPLVILSPGTRVVFGRETYAITGTDRCLTDGMDVNFHPDDECITLTPGMNKIVYLNPVGTKDLYRGAVTINGTPDKVIISLAEITYPDGRMRNFAPPLIGTRP